MGHKVHPTIFRTQVIYTWPSRWYARLGSKEYRDFVQQDVKIRKFIRKIGKEAGVDQIKIERDHNGDVSLQISVARPGLMIGRGGSGIEDLTKKIEKDVLEGKRKVRISIVELKKPNLAAHVVGQQMANEIEKRMPFRRVMKQTLERIQRDGGALGARVIMGGRLNGAEIARRETLSWGKIPLQNLRADIDYALTEAHTNFGVIGIKVWVYRGDVFQQKRD